MRLQWLSMEHYRLHMVEEWPDGFYKEATLAAIHSAMSAPGRSRGAGVHHLPEPKEKLGTPRIPSEIGVLKRIIHTANLQCIMKHVISKRR
jgi:hypothetical protein